MTQEQALAILKTGVNVFLTGEPGSGKTHAINLYVKYLRAHGVEPAVTASTGIAATHIGGMTIHAWSGIGIRTSLSKEELGALVDRSRLTARAARTRVLIIDEISMLDAETLRTVDAACRALRRSDVPFGGMQAVLVGDFFQLPPVAREGKSPPQFAFLSSSWEATRPVVCYLSEQYRHEDKAFVAFLSSVRRGTVTQESFAMLTARRVDRAPQDGGTRLYTHNIDVDRVNEEQLGTLPGNISEFLMKSHGSKTLVVPLKRGCLSPEVLKLKKGARVIFTKNNFEVGYVNGTLGEVEGFADDGYPHIRTHRGHLIHALPMEWSIMDGPTTIAKITQVPVRLAWALTIHKSQGMTLDAAVMDLSGVFEYGQGYVALSRLRSFSGLFLLGQNERALAVHPDILVQDRDFRNQSEEADISRAHLPRAEREKLEKDFMAVCGGKNAVRTPFQKKRHRYPHARWSKHDGA